MLIKDNRYAQQKILTTLFTVVADDNGADIDDEKETVRLIVTINSSRQPTNFTNPPNFTNPRQLQGMSQ